ncbi:MAG: Smr/MutS family protein [Sphaerochaeta sp.]|jgi:DNA-nicking Smr family endonuclease|nr:Smr/MutS family protein [Sphaerochaeta sp.]MDX9914394.1 Smr/MutS family protein [Sphaerochaeta sp.]
MAKTKDKPTVRIKTVASDRLDPSTGRKKPIVSGYDPKADFGDVLKSWESTGELGSLPKPAQRRVGMKSSKNFGEILAEWEGEKKAPASVSDPLPKKSDRYKPTKDFGALLDAFEGRSGKKKPQPISPKKRPQRPTGPMTPSKEIGEALEQKAELDDEREVKAAWSFADTYRQWSQQSDEERAIEKSLKSERTPIVPRTIAELRAMIPEATLDLHGLTVLEAEKASADFLREAALRKLSKIAIITGKGLHNDKGYSLLRDAALGQIRLSGVVREAYTPAERHGGSGVIWIIMKRG